MNFKERLSRLLGRQYDQAKNSLFPDPLEAFDETPIQEVMLPLFDSSEIHIQVLTRALKVRTVYEKKLRGDQREKVTQLGLFLVAALITEILYLTEIVRISAGENTWPQHFLAVLFIVASIAQYRELRGITERLNRNRYSLLGYFRKLGVEVRDEATFQNLKQYIWAYVDQEALQKELDNLETEAEAIYFGGLAIEDLENGYLEEESDDDEEDDTDYFGSLIDNDDDQDH